MTLEKLPTIHIRILPLIMSLSRGLSGPVATVKLRLFSHFRSLFISVLLQLQLKRPAGDAKTPRGLALVAACLLKGIQDDFFFHIRKAGIPIQRSLAVS